MLRSVEDLFGYPILAADGDVGKLHDLLFDDESWVVRYLVVDTGTWLPGRKLLLSPAALREVDWQTQRAYVDLTKQQIEKSPEIDADRPVSRQQEKMLHTYYGWAPYWVGTGMGTPPAAVTVPPVVSGREAPEEKSQGDPHLRSAREVTGYHIGASDGEIGHAEDFIVDDESWTVRYMVVDTRNWLPGRKVLIAPRWIADVSWPERKVFVGMSRESVRNSPEYDPSAPVNREYEVRLYDYYGRPKYWS